MAGTIMMYVLPMLLGQTYDLGKDKPGLLIYPSSVAEDAVRIERYLTDSQYRMVENSDEIKDFLDVSGKLSLKIKGGLVDIGGEGRYLRDTSSKSNALEILVKVHFETETVTIPSSKRPNLNWTDLNSAYLGTHYCRSITYGGDLLAMIRISGTDQYDLERIKGAVNAGVKTTGGSFEGDIKGKLELLKQNAQGSNSMEINYYASVPLHGVSYTVDGIIKLIDDFPDHVKKVNNGLGNPLKMELYPLSSLKEGYPPYSENRALTDELNDLENQFDDLQKTRSLFGIWINELPPTMSNSVKQKMDNFAKKLNSIYASYLTTISNLDIAEGASTQSIKDAFEMYKDNEFILPQKYYRKFLSLQKEIYEEAPELRIKIGGARYVHWGRSDCTSNETEITMSGVTASSEIQTDVGSSDFICSPLNPDLSKIEDFSNSTTQNYPNSQINSVRYNGVVDKYKSMVGKNIACATCRCTSRTTTLVKMADTSCPEGWTKEYEGYLMAPGKNDVKGEYICVDKDLTEPNGKVAFETSEKNAKKLSEVTVTCGSLPCEPYEEKKVIECVVCTI